MKFTVTTMPIVFSLCEMGCIIAQYIQLFGHKPTRVELILYVENMIRTGLRDQISDSYKYLKNGRTNAQLDVVCLAGRQATLEHFEVNACPLSEDKDDN